MNRREFCAAAGAVVAAKGVGAGDSAVVDVAAIDRDRILRAANAYLNEKPIAVTASHSPRSAGGLHDFYSEGDYWWPDPKNPGGPYIRRDGETNPQNFTAHREAMVRLSLQVPALAAAWKIARNAAMRRKYAAKVGEHLTAWFVDEKTKMNPNLEYAQAISGVNKGRGIGIIDTIHLVEVARAAKVMEGALGKATNAVVGKWFADYLQWMTTSKNGAEERDAKNNHGSCWVMQAAEFAMYTRNTKWMEWCRERFRTVLIPNQVAADGSLPLELARTKPYSYALFDMDILSAICQILSGPRDNLWAFKTGDGRGMKKVIEYMFPFIEDKKKWPLKPDVEYFDDLPVRQPSLLFGGLAYDQPQWIALWKRLDADPKAGEIIRNFPIRQPVLWV
ncbi:MAG TPA: alginate lyase family protein [Acidobacteriaceae bacterium]|nr:alginate lyase family protein [Acidobacteriaceae bacterium]